MYLEHTAGGCWWGISTSTSTSTPVRSISGPSHSVVSTEQYIVVLHLPSHTVSWETVPTVPSPPRRVSPTTGSSWTVDNNCDEHHEGAHHSMPATPSCSSPWSAMAGFASWCGVINTYQPATSSPSQPGPLCELPSEDVSCGGKTRRPQPRDAGRTSNTKTEGVSAGSPRPLPLPPCHRCPSPSWPTMRSGLSLLVPQQN